jgi:hypothetical protein
MLTSNVWTEAGMHNGAMGYVRDILYQALDDPYNGILPVAVVVQFDTLAPGVSFLTTDDPHASRTAAIPDNNICWKAKTGAFLSRSRFGAR